VNEYMAVDNGGCFYLDSLYTLSSVLHGTKPASCCALYWL